MVASGGLAIGRWRRTKGSSLKKGSKHLQRERQPAVAPVVAPNRAGRDLVVGDVHGCFGTLARAVAELRFDPRRDRLFGVGDLVNRGPRSEAALGWLEDRFHVVTLGNHDRAVRDLLRGRLSGSGLRLKGWLGRVDPVCHPRWHAALSKMPVALTIEIVHGPVGVIHAQVPDSSWNRTLELLATGDEDIEDVALLGFEAEEEEARARARPVEGLRALVHGHWTVEEVRATHNRWNVDTGAGVPGLDRLSIVEVNGPRLRAWTFGVDES